jgi:hypothetical protein
MKNGLAVAAKERDALGGNAESSTSGDRGFGEHFAQAKRQLTEFTGNAGVLLGDAKNFLAQRGRKPDGGVAQKSGLEVWRCARDAREGNVDAVSGRAGHQTENKHRFGGHRV